MRYNWNPKALSYWEMWVCGNILNLIPQYPVGTNNNIIQYYDEEGREKRRGELR